MSPRYTDSKSVLQLLSWLRFGFGELRQVPLQENERRAEGGTSIINSLPWVLGLELNLISPADKEYRWPSLGSEIQRKEGEEGKLVAFLMDRWSSFHFFLPCLYTQRLTGWFESMLNFFYYYSSFCAVLWRLCMRNCLEGMLHLAVLGLNFARCSSHSDPVLGNWQVCQIVCALLNYFLKHFAISMMVVHHNIASWCLPLLCSCWVWIRLTRCMMIYTSNVIFFVYLISNVRWAQNKRKTCSMIHYDCIIFNWDYHYGCRGKVSITAFYASIVHIYIYNIYIYIYIYVHFAAICYCNQSQIVLGVDILFSWFY